MKAWHCWISLSLFFMFWSFSKGYAMTGDLLNVSPELSVFSLIFAGIGIRSRLKKNRHSQSFDDVLDFREEDRKN